MISLATGDKIQGDSTNATQVDYTISGIAATARAPLANGQLAAAKGDLYTATGADTVLSIVLVNTGAGVNSVNLYYLPSGGTARRLIPKALALQPGYSLHFDGQHVMVMDTNGLIVSGANVSDTAFASSWNGVTTIAPSKNSVWAALGTGASPAHVGLTLSGLTASLPVVTDGSKNLASIALTGATSLRKSLGLETSDSPSFTGVNLSGLTASQIVATDGSKNLQSLAVATYPSLAELSYVKGVTSGIQAQLNGLLPIPGGWSTPGFNAANFTGSGGMTWTVAGGNVGTYAYTIVGKTMTVAFGLTATTVGGTPGTSLFNAIPGGNTATKQVNGTFYGLDNLVRQMGWLVVAAGSQVISLNKVDASVWTASTGQTYAWGEITFEIN